MLSEFVMVRWCCRLHLNSRAHRLIALVCVFASQLLMAQNNNVQDNNAQRSSLPDSANSIFNANLNLNTSTGVIKSENDARDYRYLVLDNQLRVLLISDPSTAKAAAALAVSVGANQNPSHRPGLAHFLEHMLFLGSEKYPNAGEYQEFIAQHAGSFNAYTAAENTHYFFEIDTDQLHPALDRFAQFFIAPLFSAEYVERERNAVHSEYLATLKDDARRAGDVYRAVMNPLHPSARFSAGNLTTLADLEGHPVREDMIAFYQQYYSSHLMNLVVLGRENLDMLEASVRAGFNAVPKRDIKITNKYPPLFDKQRLPASLEMKPEKELRQLTFNFPIPNPDQYYAKKPFAYIANFLEHEGEGSLLSLLKRLGWAEAISADTGLHSRSDAVFQLSIQLTPQGVQARNQIVSLVFYCIEQLQVRGLSVWRYSEFQQLADLDFRFQEKSTPLQTVTAVADAMRTYSTKDILRGDYLYTGYDERLIKKSLSYLTGDNLLLVLTAPDVEPYRVSPFYAAPFAVRAGVPELLELKQGVRKELFLPGKNIFIPNRLAVKSSSMLEENAAADAKPQLISGSKNMRVWFAQDQQFMQPRALINLRIKSPLVAASADGAARAQLFAALVADQLNEFSYPARLAGINHAITANPRGYDISIFGYSSRQGLLMNKIMEVMRTSQFNEERFTLIKENLLRSLYNQNKNLPSQVLARQVPVLQSDPAWSNAELIAALKHTTLEQFSRFAGRQLIDAKMDALFYGNYFRAEALKLAVLVEHELLDRQAGRDLPPASLLMLPKGSEQPWLYANALEHGDNIVGLLIQSPSTSIEDSAHMMLVRQLLQTAIYHKLSTDKQSGERLAAIAAPVLNLENNLLVMQSPGTREEKIIEEITLFLDAQHTRLDQDFKNNQQSLIEKLREPARSLKELGERYWAAITNYDEQFSRRTELAEAVAQITPESLSNYYRSVFMDKNRRLWLTSGALVERENFLLIDDLTTHKHLMITIVQL